MPSCYQWNLELLLPDLIAELGSKATKDRLEEERRKRQGLSLFFSRLQKCE